MQAYFVAAPHIACTLCFGMPPVADLSLHIALKASDLPQGCDANEMLPVFRERMDAVRKPVMEGAILGPVILGTEPGHAP